MSSFSKKTTNILLHNKQNEIIQTNTLIKKKGLRLWQMKNYLGVFRRCNEQI